MGLVRTWIRSASTALGASLLVPAAVILVAAGVAIGGGGLGGIGLLGQLVEGPREPLAAVGQLDPADDTLAADASALIAATPAGGGTAGGSAPSGGDGGGDTPGERSPGGPGGGDPGGGNPGGGDGGEVTPPAGTDPDSDDPSMPETPAPLQGIDQGTDEIVEQLPEPVGPLSGELIDRVVEIGEQLLTQPGVRELVGGIGSAP